MKDRSYFLNTALALVLALAMAAVVLFRTFAPAVILPELNIPNMVLLSLIALLAEYYVAPGTKGCYVCITLFAALSFGLLPAAAGYVPFAECWKTAVIGGITFALTTWVFRSMADRLSTGPNAKAAPIITAFGLYLATQAFTGILL